LSHQAAAAAAAAADTNSLHRRLSEWKARRGAPRLTSPRLARGKNSYVCLPCRGAWGRRRREARTSATTDQACCARTGPTPVAGCGGVNWTLWFRPTTAAGRTFRAVMKEDRDDVVGLYIEVEDGLLLAAL